MSHASHCPLHGALQQKPSLQMLFVHASLVVQAWPFGRFFSHLPAEHQPSAAQSAVVTQLVVQEPVAAAHW